MYDLIVIGAGPGGYEAAGHAGRMGKKVALIEKERVGGTCLNVGCIPAKTFLRSSKLFRECGESESYGVRVGSREFDMRAVVARKDRVVGTLTKGVEGMLKRAGVETLSGQARLVARNTVEVGERRLEAANILLATGSRPAVPPISGIGSARVLDSNTVFGIAAIPRRVAIVGGGYIGLEFACFFNEIGCEVAVYEMLPHIAAGCDRDISSRLLQILKRKGIEFHLSAKVTAIDESALHYTEADGSLGADSADCILNAAGRAPNVAGLGLEEAGVDFNAQGIRTSDRGQTNVAGIWACGDATGRRMLAHVATREGIAAVNNMFGRKDRIRYNAIPAVIYTHPEVATVGQTEEELQAAGVEYKKSIVPMAVAGRFLVENEGGSGIVKALAGARHGEILGVHAIGDSSSEFIVAAAVMVATEMCVADAAGIVFPHPTVSEALREAILAMG
jgi:dihydrolipoamide dehydrogenase